MDRGHGCLGQRRLDRQLPEQAAEAFGEAAGHDAEAHDGPHAIVLMSMGAALIGPINQP